jgi:hypothetical protein
MSRTLQGFREKHRISFRRHVEDVTVSEVPVVSSFISQGDLVVTRSVSSWKLRTWKSCHYGDFYYEIDAHLLRPV